MGTTTGQKRISQSLSFKYEQFRLDNLDSIISKGFDLVKNTELFRCKFTPLWNELMKQSGALVLDTPHFQSAMNGMLMKLSCDFNGVLYKNVSILQSSPFIVIDKGESDMSTESMLILDAFRAVSRYSIDNIGTIGDMENSYMKFLEDSSFLQSNHEKYFSSRGVPPFDIISNSKKLTKYLKTFKAGYEVCLQMKKYVNEVNACLREYEEYCRNEEVMKKFERIGREANRNSTLKPPKIMFKYSPEKKLGHYEDYYDRVLDYAKIDKNCQQILSVYSLKLKEKEIQYRKSSATLQKMQGQYEGEEARNKMIEENKNEERESLKGKEDDIVNIYEINKEIEITNKEKDVNHSHMMIRPVNSSNPHSSNNQKQISNYSDPNRKRSKSNKCSVSNKKKNEEEDDIIDNCDSDEFSSSADIKEIAKSLSKDHSTSKGKEKNKDKDKEQNLQLQFTSPMHIGITSLDKLHLKESLNLFPQSNVYPTSFVPIKTRNIFITGMSNGAIVITNIIDLTEDKVIQCHNKKITSLLYLNDNKTIISGSKDGNIYKHNLDTYTSTLIGKEPEPIKSMVNLFNDYSILVSSNKTIIAYDYTNNTKLFSFIAHDDKINDMAYNLERDMLVTCSKDKKIKLWNSSNQECIGVLKGINNSIKSLCFAQRKDHLLVISASVDGFVTFWNLSDKTLTRSVKMSNTVIRLVYLENEKNVLGVNGNNSFTIFDLKTNESKDYKSEESDLKYSSGMYFDDGNTIALGTRNGFVQLWSTCYN